MFFKFIVVLFFVTNVTCQFNNVAFKKIGSYDVTPDIVKSYYIPRYFKSTWMETRAICKSYDMEIASLDTEAESDHFLSMFHQQPDLLASDAYAYAHIGGMTLIGGSKTDWYWVNSNNHIDYDIKFYPGEPNNFAGVEQCLAIGQVGGNVGYFDITCMTTYAVLFVCQHEMSN